MRKIDKSYKIMLVIAFMLSLLIFGCSKKNGTNPQSEPPQIPPLETFLMDFGDFQSGSQTQMALGKSSQILSKDNWGWAAFNVGVWNTLISVGLSVPVAAFAKSLQATSQQQDDGSWVWEYDFTVLNVKYSAELQGKMTDSGVQWKMFISKENEYQNFLWYSGESDFLATEGSWILNQNPDQPVPLLEIVWHRHVQEATKDIRYKNIEPDGPENGGYIFYGITQEMPYNAFYDIYNKGKDNFTNIRWNRTARDGRVKDPDHFGDSDWHCWNGNLEDAVCQ